MSDLYPDQPAAAPFKPRQMTDEEFEALEEILTSEVVPEDCMDLEMLDGYLAGVLLSPRPIAPERWMPGVWSAHGDELGFGSGSGMQRAIRLVKAYYNEMLASLGLDDEDEACWEPFCFATAEGDTVKLGEAWMDGFGQGLELWPENWQDGLDPEAIDAVSETLDAVLEPWGSEEAGAADEETRLGWLTEVGEAVNDIFAHWRDLDLAPPAPLSTAAPRKPGAASPGRNDPCPCGSGKKYKKCCGQLEGGSEG